MKQDTHLKAITEQVRTLSNETGTPDRARQDIRQTLKSEAIPHISFTHNGIRNNCCVCNAPYHYTRECHSALLGNRGKQEVITSSNSDMHLHYKGSVNWANTRRSVRLKAQNMTRDPQLRGKRGAIDDKRRKEETTGNPFDSLSARKGRDITSLNTKLPYDSQSARKGSVSISLNTKIPYDSQSGR